MSISSFTIKMRPKYKLIFLGDQAVGKTCLIQQFVHGKYQQSQTPTVGIDFVVTNIHHKGRQFRLQLWDTAGQQRFKSLIPSYLRDSQCAIIVYDVNNKQSFENVQKWLQLYKENSDQNSLVIIVGNKIDLKNRFIGYDQVRNKMNKLKIQHLQVSAKTGKNINQLFYKVIELIEDKQSKPILDSKILQTSDPSIQNIHQKQENKVVKLTVYSHRNSHRNSPNKGNNNEQIKTKCC